jgi:hypothetical protein
MSATAHQILMRCLRRPVIWLMALAVVVYGHSSVMVQLLGPAHRHDTAVSSSVPGWLDHAAAAFSDVRAWRAELRERLLPGQHGQGHIDGAPHAHPHGHPHAEAGARSAHDGSGHEHSHASYQRHHHEPHDATVIALDGADGSSAADAASMAGAGSATLPLALAPRWAPPSMSDPQGSWSDRASARWTDASVFPPEHPPRT